MTVGQILRIPAGSEGIPLKELGIDNEFQIPYLLPVWVSDKNKHVGFISENQKNNFIRQTFYKYSIDLNLFNDLVKSKKINMRNLSAMTCGNDRTIERKINNKRDFNYDQAMKISKVLTVDLKELFDEKKPSENAKYTNK